VEREHEHSFPRRLYLMRHGDCRSDQTKRFIGQTDVPLNQEGLAAGRAWQAILSTKGLEHVYCSDLARSLSTGQIITSGSSIPLEVLPELREIDLGEWEGLPVAHVRNQFPREYKERGRDLAHFHPPGGESFSDLRDRVVPAFQQIVARMQGPVLIVGHAGVNRVILCHVLGMPLGLLFRIEQPYGALSVLICEDGTEIRVEALNLLPDRSQGGML